MSTELHDSPAEPLLPPRAKIIPHRLEMHGHVRIDPYYWLRERDNPEVLAYLQAENDYADALMAHTRALREILFHEMKGRIKPSDVSVPFRYGEYFYYVRYEPESEYPIYCRKHGTLEAPEEVMLDGNALARGHDYFTIGSWTVSERHDLLAYAVDTQGRRIYTLYVKHLLTGEQLPDTIPAFTGNMVWANDNRTLFYSRQDPDTLRSSRIYRHVLGTDPAHDELVYEESDETFSVHVTKSKSRHYLFIVSDQSITTEYRYLDANHPFEQPTILLPRERGHEFDVDHIGDRFVIRTNDRAMNFRLVTAPVTNPDRAHWDELVPHREDVLLEGFELFDRAVVLEERKLGLVHLRVKPWEGTGEHELEFPEPAYLAMLGDNYELSSNTLRYEYTSMTTPLSVYDYNMETRETVLLKQDEVLGGFDAGNYRTERLFAPSHDGVVVPISLVYRKGFVREGSHPLLLYGYGAYGISLDASFSASRLSLLDRGVVFAIAHVRGGEELGRQWYEQGKLLNKKNTFYDFIACAEYLRDQQYVHPEKLFAMGGSAGGLLMGAVMNMRPDLFAGIVAKVPFVDVLTTMLDPTIPLTTGEYDEWGDPHDKVFYDYILSYSPYDNVEAKDYPHLLVTAGLHDSQVQYWEPAKWVAKLRALKTDRHRLILKTNMEAGHSGASGRFKPYEEIAFHYAFLLDVLAQQALISDQEAPGSSAL